MCVFHIANLDSIISHIYSNRYSVPQYFGDWYITQVPKIDIYIFLIPTGYSLWCFHQKDYIMFRQTMCWRPCLPCLAVLSLWVCQHRGSKVQSHCWSNALLRLQESWKWGSMQAWQPSPGALLCSRAAAWSILQVTFTTSFPGWMHIRAGGLGLQLWQENECGHNAKHAYCFLVLPHLFYWDVVCLCLK